MVIHGHSPFNHAQEYTGTESRAITALKSWACCTADVATLLIFGATLSAVTASVKWVLKLLFTGNAPLFLQQLM